MSMRRVSWVARSCFSARPWPCRRRRAAPSAARRGRRPPGECRGRDRRAPWRRRDPHPIYPRSLPLGGTGRLYACRPLSGGHRPAADRIPPAAKAGESGRGLVKAFRFGLVMPGGSRIVIDAAGPVRIDKAFVLDSVDGQPARLVVDLVAIDRDSFLRNLALEAKPRRQAERRARPSGNRRRRHPAGGRHRSWPWRARYRHHGRQRRDGEIDRAGIRPATARAARPDGQIPGGDDPRRRQLRVAGRAGTDRARPQGGAVHLDPCRRARPAGR